MQALEKYKPFKATGDDFSDSNPIFSYYFYRYFMETAIDICKNVEDPLECQVFKCEQNSFERQLNLFPFHFM